jgi:hypothetical protein
LEEMTQQLQQQHQHAADGVSVQAQQAGLLQGVVQGECNATHTALLPESKRPVNAG